MTKLQMLANSTEGRRAMLNEVRDRPSNEFMLRGMSDMVEDQEETVYLPQVQAIKYIKQFSGSLTLTNAR